jgi:hypothetical protein
MATIPDIRLGVEVSSAAVIRPGDTLVLGFSHTLSEAESAWISEKISAEMPGVRVTVIDRLTHMAAYRPREEAGPEGARL